jgi:PAS domain-containing protein
MPILTILIVILVVGVILWLINSYIPMQRTVKGILNAVVIIILVVWLLKVFGMSKSTFTDIQGEKPKKKKSILRKELYASEIRYRRLFESAKDGILILDAETGKIVDVNPFLIDLLGYSKNEFIEKSIWEIGAFQDIY